MSQGSPDPFGPRSSPNNYSLLEPLPKHKQIKLEFIQVCTSAPLPGVKDGARKQILKSVSGAALPGELMALMGPSGAGKSSLLRALAARQPGSVHVEGSIKYNNRRLNNSIRSKVAFVPQDDLLYPNLSAEELLYFTAMLSMPRRMPRERKENLVEEAIQILGLQGCRKTPIRNQGVSISGGERKRVSVACELLTNPALIFLDEPTSGLDSTAALTLVKILKDLALNGRGVICTIHQPSATVFSYFEKVMLLSGGEAMYYGQRQAAIDWFGAGGVSCPLGVNLAEFIIDIAACSVQDQPDPSLTRDNLTMVFNRWMNSSSTHLENGITKQDLDMMPMLLKSVESGERLQFLPDSGSSSPLKISADDDFDDITQIAEEKIALQQMKEERIGWFAQFWLLYKRSVGSRRFEVMSIQKFILISAWAVFAGIVWFGQGLQNTTQSLQNIGGLIWILTLFQFNQGMLGSLFVFTPEVACITKDRAGGMYSLLAYYLARSLSELQLETPFFILQNTIVYVMVFLRPTVSAYLQTMIISVLVSLTSQGFGQMIGTAIKSPRNKQAATSLAIQVTLITSGFLVILPVWVDWMKYFSIMRYGYVALTYIQFSGRTVEFCPNTGDLSCIQLPWEVALGGTANLTPPLWLDYILLVVWVFVARSLTFIVLLQRTNPASLGGRGPK